jgi:hypothetical protein
MFEYGIGGTERKLDDANEGVAEIPQNRTIFAQKLSQEAPYVPQAVYGLKTTEEVFEHFQPSAEVEFDTEDGSSINENLQFRNLGDFGSKGIKNQSKYLQELANKEDQHLKIIKELKSNKAIQTIVQNKETKAAFLTAIQALINELEEAGA